jgi:hypothetical protein
LPKQFYGLLSWAEIEVVEVDLVVAIVVASADLVVVAPVEVVQVEAGNYYRIPPAAHFNILIIRLI